jgi:hypothetical protein
MRPSLSHPPESRRLLVAGSVCWMLRDGESHLQTKEG